MKASDGGGTGAPPLDFLDDGLLHALNPFAIPDWMFGGFLIALLILFLIGGFGIQFSQEQARDVECREHRMRTDMSNTPHTKPPTPPSED